MRLKKRKNNKVKTIASRVTETEFNKIKLKAGLYAEGNVSDWLAIAALKYKPEKKDLD